MKNLQADVQALRSENDTLRAELSTVKSSATGVPPRTIASVARRLSYEDDDRQDTDNVQVLEAGGSEKKATKNTANTEMQRQKDMTDRYNSEGERSNRRHTHRNSRCESNLLDDVKQELKEMREMIQRIPGVPKPLEKVTPTSYADSPFTNDIAMVEIPKQFTTPHMKMYDGSANPEEYRATNVYCAYFQILQGVMFVQGIWLNNNRTCSSMVCEPTKWHNSFIC